jgi:hypothetical protein
LRRRAVALALLIVSACSRPASDASPPQSAVIDDGSMPSVGVDSGIELSDSSSPSASIEAGALDTSYFTALPVRGKSIGHTSVVFKLSLDNGQIAAYKPRSHVGGERFHGEIAAYRLGQAWGINNVPPALARSFLAADLRGSLDQKALDLFSREVVAETDGSVRGALIPWIGNLEFLPLETAKERARWGAWLNSTDAGELDDCDASLASQISTMILFDTMTGNWDRWSGGNIGVSRLGTRNGCDKVLYIDNDGAFFDPVPAAPLASQLALVKKMNRFSRSFVTKLRAVSEADLQTAIGDEMPGKQLLSRTVIDAFFARRKTVLANVEAKITANGEASTLSLP